MIWDFSISTFAIELYQGLKGQLQFGLEVICIVFLVLSTIIKLLDLLQSFRSYNLQDYVFDLQHWYNWLHTALMWYGWWLWLQCYRQGQSFSMEPAYPVLADTQASARLFSTDPEAELKYLELVHRVKELSSLSQQYRAIAGLCAFMFIFCLLEAFRFQPRLGLISNTLKVVSPDLCNFVILLYTTSGRLQM